MGIAGCVTVKKVVFIAVISNIKNLNMYNLRKTASICDLNEGIPLP